jgi:hypothetical protein
MKIKFCFCILFLLPGILPGQPKDSLAITLNLEQDSIEIIALLNFSFTLENQSNSPIDLIPMAFTYKIIRRLGEVYLETKKNSDTIWLKSNCKIGYERSARDYLTITRRTLAPKESIVSEKITCSTLDVFHDEGLYQLRIRYTTPNNQTHFSEPQTIYVKPFRACLGIFACHGS